MNNSFSIRHLLVNKKDKQQPNDKDKLQKELFQNKYIFLLYTIDNMSIPVQLTTDVR